MRTMRAIVALVAFFMLCGGAHAKRMALVIGNAEYSELSDLQKTLGDAGGYRDVLTELGFDVTLRTDLDYFSTARAVGAFVGRIAPGDEVAFVFAGHGWSDGRTNYLLPTNTPKSGTSAELAQLSLPLKNGTNGILDQITQRGARLSFSVIDACRDNPFIQADGTRSAGLARGGLSAISASAGSFVVYSAGEGQLALDRLSDSDQNPYSVFSRVFIPKLRSGVSLEQAADKTSLEVLTLAAQIGHSQQPAYYDQAAGQTVLKAGKTSLSRIAVTPNPTVSPQASSFDVYATMWEKCEAGDERFCRRLAEDDGGTGYGELAAVLITPTANAASVSTSPAVASPPAPAECNPALLPEGWECSPDGQPRLKQVVMTQPVPAPPVPAPSRGAYGIASSSWLRGSAGGSGSVFREGFGLPEMVVIPSGSFMMGSPSNEVGRDDDEGPQRRVTIPGAFALGRTEVTVGEWRRFMGETGHVMGSSCRTYEDGKAADRSGRGWQSPGFAQGEDHPVVCVSWDDARADIGWLNGKVSGSPYRLPSESE